MYPNGEVPLSKLIHVSGNIYLPPGTLSRVNWAIEHAYAKYGVRLRITGQHSTAWNTWNGYRPLPAQVAYRVAYGIMAAVPRTSSHGGTYRGKEVFAVDFDNWAELGWARFAAIMRLAGLTVDFVTPTERWHVGDFNNAWALPSFASGGGGSALNPGSSTTLIVREEDDMKDKYMWTRRADGVILNAIYNTVSGYFQAFESNNSEYNTAKAKGHDLAGPTFEVSRSDWDSTERACSAVRTGKS